MGTWERVRERTTKSGEVAVTWSLPTSPPEKGVRPRLRDALERARNRLGEEATTEQVKGNEKEKKDKNLKRDRAVISGATEKLRCVRENLAVGSKRRECVYLRPGIRVPCLPSQGSRACRNNKTASSLIHNLRRRDSSPSSYKRRPRERDSRKEEKKEKTGETGRKKGAKRLTSNPATLGEWRERESRSGREAANGCSAPSRTTTWS